MKARWTNEDVAELLGVRAVYKHYRVDEDAQRVAGAVDTMLACGVTVDILSELYGEDSRIASMQADPLFLEEFDFLPVLHYQKGESKWGPIVRIKSKNGGPDKQMRRGPATRGGATICYLYRDRELVSQGFTVCLPMDSFCYQTGRDHAFKAAVEKL